MLLQGDAQTWTAPTSVCTDFNQVLRAIQVQDWPSSWGQRLAHVETCRIDNKATSDGADTQVGTKPSLHCICCLDRITVMPLNAGFREAENDTETWLEDDYCLVGSSSLLCHFLHPHVENARKRKETKVRHHCWACENTFHLAEAPLPADIDSSRKIWLEDRLAFNQGKKSELSCIKEKGIWQRRSNHGRVMRVWYVLKWRTDASGNPKPKTGPQGALEISSATLSRSSGQVFLAISVKKGWSKFTADVCVCWRFLMRHGVSGQITWGKLGLHLLEGETLGFVKLPRVSRPEHSGRWVLSEVGFIGGSAVRGLRKKQARQLLADHLRSHQISLSANSTFQAAKRKTVQERKDNARRNAISVKKSLTMMTIANEFKPAMAQNKEQDVICWDFALLVMVTLLCIGLFHIIGWQAGWRLWRPRLKHRLTNHHSLHCREERRVQIDIRQGLRNTKSSSKEEMKPWTKWGTKGIVGDQMSTV